MAELNQGNHPRKYIQHNYHDHSAETPPSNEHCAIMQCSPQTGLFESDPDTYTPNQDVSLCTPDRFPLKLHKLLVMVETAGDTDIIAWQIHGRAFKINKPKEFSDKVMPLHFCHRHITSFYRQLNIYGFLKITQGPDKGSYYHELFLRGMHFLSKKILRIKVKGTFVKGIPNPAKEPNFYEMPFVNLTPCHAKASASFQPKQDNLLLEDEVITTDKVSPLQQAKGEAFLLEGVDLNISSMKNDPFDNMVFIDVFCDDDELFPLLPEVELPIDPAQMKKDPINDKGIFDDISLEDDVSNSKQYYSLLEFVDMCALLQMIIDNLK